MCYLTGIGCFVNSLPSLRACQFRCTGAVDYVLGVVPVLAAGAAVAVGAAAFFFAAGAFFSGCDAGGYCGGVRAASPTANADATNAAVNTRFMSVILLLPC